MAHGNGDSYPDFKEEIKTYLLHKYKDRSIKILDVGAGNGNYSRLLRPYFKNIDAVEAYEPNIIDNKLERLYGEVYNYDAVGDEFIPYELYDVIILGDVLEHIDIIKAQELITFLCNGNKEIIVAVPWLYEQGAMYGNEYEVHKQPDLTLEVMKQRYPGLDILFKNDRYAVYINSLINETVCAELSTRGRYWSTLATTLIAVATQLRTPDKLIIYDDNTEPQDLRDNWLYQYVFGLLREKNIIWSVQFTKGRGQVPNHQDALMNSDCKYVWRLDDDNVPEANVLDELLKKIKSDVNIGAVSCMIHHTNNLISSAPSTIRNKMSEFGKPEFGPIEWHQIEKEYDAEHLYSTFLYNRQYGIDAGGYLTSLSRVGHCEETIFSNRIFRSGKQLKVIPTCKTFHLRNPEGGIRDNTSAAMFESDEQQFKDYYIECQGVDSKEKVFYLDNGLGDHYDFKEAFKEIVKRYEGYKIYIACCYRQVFSDLNNVHIISLAEASLKITKANIENQNVYLFMIKNNWKESIIEAYKQIYK